MTSLSHLGSAPDSESSPRQHTSEPVTVSQWWHGRCQSRLEHPCPRPKSLCSLRHWKSSLCCSKSFLCFIWDNWRFPGCEGDRFQAARVFSLGSAWNPISHAVSSEQSLIHTKVVKEVLEFEPKSGWHLKPMLFFSMLLSPQMILKSGWLIDLYSYIFI